MKQYKLIKEYPNSPILGTIASFNDKDQWFFHYKPKIRDSDDLHSIGNNEITLYSDFWQEILQKDYEILSFIRIKLGKGSSLVGDIYVKNKLNTFEKQMFPWCSYTEEEMFNGQKDNLNNGCFAINSIKRISDNEIFTLGDNFKHLNNKHYKNLIIKSIEPYDKFISPIRMSLSSKDATIPLDLCSKSKNPLFITEDGIEIFENKTTGLYYVNIYTWYQGKDVSGLIGNLNHDGFKYFSKEKAAEKYIILNKPCLSISDIDKNLENIKEALHTITFKEFLKNIVKSKLKL